MQMISADMQGGGGERLGVGVHYLLQWSRQFLRLVLDLDTG